MQIFVTTEFIGFHRYPEAPDEVKFLRALHRHLFKVSAHFEVNHEDRQLEFFIVKGKLNLSIVNIQQRAKTDSWSCESWCRSIRDDLIRTHGLDPIQVEVSEDGENGAIWTKD